MADITSIEKEMERKRIERDIKEYLQRGKKITRLPMGDCVLGGSPPEITRRRLWKQD